MMSSQPMQPTEGPRPIEITRVNQHDVKIRWKGGREVVYPARFLRFHCPCAVCVDEMTGVRRLRESSLPGDVHPVAIEPVGHYAIQIYWSDGHNTGIYTWERLHELISMLPTELAPPLKSP
jgi:DUF971 family protein